MALAECTKFRWQREEVFIHAIKDNIQGHALVTVGAKMFVLGGAHEGNVPHFTLVYLDTSTNTWHDRTGLPNAPNGITTKIMCFLKHDTIYVLGEWVPRRRLWLFDTVLEEWNTVECTGVFPEQLKASRLEYMEHRNATIKFGVEDGISNATWELALLRLTDMQWIIPKCVGRTPDGNTYAVLSTVVGNTIYVYIGTSGKLFLLHCDGYGPIRWSELTFAYAFPHCPAARRHASLTYIGGNIIVLHGGLDRTWRKDVWFFSVVDHKWRELIEDNADAPLQVRDCSFAGCHEAAYVNNKLVVLGGYGSLLGELAINVMEGTL